MELTFTMVVLVGLALFKIAWASVGKTIKTKKLLFQIENVFRWICIR